MHEIRKQRRENLDKSVQNSLRHDDEREDRELRRFIASALTAEMMKSVPGAANQAEPDKPPTEIPESERPLQWNNQEQGR
jgi:peptide-N4-(N-acetyl-beta-glucosaminyl)asparagine amidase